jgi:hypothetical protein
MPSTHVQAGTGPSLANLESLTFAGLVALLTIEGRLLRAPQVLTGGTSINHPTGTRLIRIRGCGGGGAGGGTDAAAGAMGANGSSAGYLEHVYTAASLTSSYTIGAAGTGVSGAGGGNGGDSTFTHNGDTKTAGGGNGGGVVAGGTTVAVASAGVAGTVSGSPLVAVPGQRGGQAVRPTAATTPCFHTDSGGHTPLGSGGGVRGVTGAASAGLVATGFGAGGSGRLNGTSTAAGAGADGTAGVWIVEEYA